MELPRVFTIWVALFSTLFLSGIDTAELVYEHYRLPTSVRPVKYELKVITHLEDPKDLKFNGDVLIELHIVEDTNNITLHAQNLTINESSIKLKRLQGSESETDEENCIKSTATNEQHNYFIMQLCKMARKGEQYQLYIPFSAVLNEDLNGYYKSAYEDREKNETRWLSVTQFEPVHARKAFPCFDEPVYKANFTVTLGHHKQYTALSNMPLKERKPMSDKADWIWSEFEESVPMSTYLVAYTVNDFAYKTSEISLENKVLFRTWARADAYDQCSYAGDVGSKILQFYDNIFALKFPLPKVDQIAIPDFGAGAMENWGLITYREMALLYAENVSSLSSQQRVTEVIAHELAHQWFGNLVTMKWWSDLWLNEGFATYVSLLGVSHAQPNWNYLATQSVQQLLQIFRIDALSGSRPISQPVTDSKQIEKMFDAISYTKGAVLLRMMHAFLGDEVSQRGIIDYLGKNAYNNAEQDDLWHSINKTAHASHVLPENYDIKTIMDSWTLQTGYPLITVTRDYEKGTAKITQTRYLINSNAFYRTAEQNCWWVPLTYTTKSERNFEEITPKTWLECNENQLPIEKELTAMPAENEWVIFNLQLGSLYKVQYDERNWNLLIDTLVSNDYLTIDVVNRAHLIEDALALAWSSDENYDLALRLVGYLNREKQYLPWKVALSRLQVIRNTISSTAVYERFKEYIVEILTPIYIHLHGLNSTYMVELLEHAPQIIQHKVLIGNWACANEIEDCVPRASSYFAEWRKSTKPDTQNPIPVDLREVVYCFALRYGDKKDFEFLKARYENTNIVSEKLVIAMSLGCSRNLQELEHLLRSTYQKDSKIQKEDSKEIFTSIARSEVGASLAKEFFVENLELLHEFYASNPTDFASLLEALADQVNNRSSFEDLKDLIESNQNYFDDIELPTQRALETAETQVQWMEKNYDDFSRNLRTQLGK